jgi:hypothetical protein
MDESRSQSIETAWARLVLAVAAAESALQAFASQPGDKADVLRAGLAHSATIPTALTAVLRLPEAESRPLLDELVFQASGWHPYYDEARNAIARFPEDWLSTRLLDAIWQAIDRDGDQTTYRLAAELAASLQPEVLPAIIERALSSADADVVEAGRDLRARFSQSTD